ncbi:MAG: cytochrome c oxidase subunit [Ilumatobacteraceae bacterium]|nr:cytochrome c oxidase subunit [Ilumatobacteraceae bacterium]
MPEPATEQGDRVASLWSGMFIAALVVGAIVWGLIAWALIRYRHRGGEAAVPHQRASNLPIEIAYTAVPILIVIVLFGFTMATDREVKELDAHPDLTVEVVGYQWGWSFRYPAQDLEMVGDPTTGDGPEMVLPIGATTRLDLVSTDVIHSFWVPRFLSKRDLIPGRTNEMDVTPNRAGTYTGRCAEYCGLDHWRMNFRVRVVPQEEFDRWVAAEQDRQS